MKFIYDVSNDQRIINHENIMLETYSKIINRYSSRFELYGCTLVVELFWVNFLTEQRSYHRLPFHNGYSCYVYCEVQKDGKEVHVKSTDGEVDDYSLSASWVVSSIERHFFKTQVSLNSDTSHIEKEMKELIQLLSNSQ